MAAQRRRSYVLARLLGDPLPTKPSGSQFKINLLVSRLPALKSGIDPAIAFAGTFHLGESMTELEAAWEQPRRPTSRGERRVSSTATPSPTVRSSATTWPAPAHRR